MCHSSNVLLRTRLRLDSLRNNIRPNVLRRMLFVVRVYVPRKSLAKFGSELLLEGLLQFCHDGFYLLVFQGILCILENE